MIYSVKKRWEHPGIGCHMQLEFEKQWLGLPAFLGLNPEIDSDILLVWMREKSSGVILASYS